MANNFNYFSPNTSGTPTTSYNRDTTPIQPVCQQIFPQPQGNVFFINNSSELQNIPVMNGMSVVICLPEGVLYFKTFQNNMPTIAIYKISAQQEDRTPNSSYTELEERIKKLEEALAKKKGGPIEWQT